MTEQVARDEEHQANSQEMQERIKEIQSIQTNILEKKISEAHELFE